MKTLSELYRENTLDFGFSYGDIEVVEEHRISYKTMQALGKVITGIKIDGEGQADTSEMTALIMGEPSPGIKATLIQGLGSHYNKEKLSRTIKRQLEDDGVIPEAEHLEAIIRLVDVLENQAVSELFQAYLANKEQPDTPR